MDPKHIKVFFNIFVHYLKIRNPEHEQTNRPFYGRNDSGGMYQGSDEAHR